MLRLTILLCFGMLAALFTLGEDRGQLRPGLAKAEAEGRLDEVWAEARAARSALPAPAVVVAEAAPEPAPIPAPEPAPAVATPVAMAASAIEVEAGRNVVRAVEEDVFTLSAIGNEPVPGEDGTAIDAALTEVAAEPEGTATPEAGGGTIWYVTADSVNVRAAPSTEADVLGRLQTGEAALLVAAVDADWGRIVIQGDGVEGYVALRFLSPTAP
jgi:hypothetical protein